MPFSVFLVVVVIFLGLVCCFFWGGLWFFFVWVGFGFFLGGGGEVFLVSCFVLAGFFSFLY